MQNKDIDSFAKIVLSPLSAAVALAMVVPSAHSAIYVVDAIKDKDGLSLNEALAKSMDSEEDDLIEFAASLKNATLSMSGVYASEEGEGGIGTGSLTIDGSGAKNLTIKMLESESDYGFLAYSSSISVNDLNLVIDRDNNEHSDGPISFNSTAFIAKYNGKLNLQNISITQADTNKGNAVGIIATKYSSANLHNVVIDGAGEGEGIYGGLLTVFDTDVTIDSAIFKDLQVGVVALQGFSADREESPFAPGMMNVSINNTLFTGNKAEQEEDIGGALVAFSKYSEDAPATKGAELARVGASLLNLSITNSTFSDNTGAITAGSFSDKYNDGKLSVDIFNSTIVNNEKYDGASALNIYGNVDLLMSHTTITNNTSGAHEEDGEAQPAVNIYQTNGKLAISNSIIAGNTANKYIEEAEGFGLDAADILVEGANEGEGGVVSSLIGKDAHEDGGKNSDLFGKGVIYGKDPLFNEIGLKYYKSSEVPTLCLTKNSPAVNAADASITKVLGLDLDQAGKKRLSDKAPDMGAVELSTTCQKKSKDDGLLGSFGTLSLASFFSLAFFRRKKH